MMYLMFSLRMNSIISSTALFSRLYRGPFLRKTWMTGSSRLFRTCRRMCGAGVTMA